MDKIVYAEEKEHEKLTEMYRTAGLEIGEGWTEVCHPVFSISARQGGALLGAATVSRRFRRLVLDYLAVEVPARGLGIGKKLTELCLDYVRGIGGSALWLAAREPEFYKRLHARETEDAALLADCLRCPDYGKDCAPKELVFYLKETS
jgi:ribosomal protein S18 acetylase RimI-like enzyme